MTLPRPDPSAITPGARFTVAYPFVREAFTYFGEGGPSEAKTWNPGVRFEQITPDEADAFADGLGEAIFEVISVHKPGRYPTRVFFTRRWRSPDGREFGKPRLHIATAEKFRRLVSGYKHRFTVESTT